MMTYFVPFGANFARQAFPSSIVVHHVCNLMEPSHCKSTLGKGTVP